MGRLAWLGLVSALACTGQVGVEDNVALSITSPVDGAVVRRTDDVNGASGIQVDVVVKVDGVLEGTEVLLDTSANPIGLESARVEAGEARFIAFTLAPGEQTLHASTATCTTDACFASIALTVVDSDTVVSISRPTEGQVVPVGDVELVVVRESGAHPQGCRIDVDGRGIGNFTWTNQAQPLSVSSSLPAGPHTVQAFCSEGLDTIPTQLVSFTVGGVAPSLTIAPATPSVLNGASDVDPATPGLQVAIAVDATGFADGESVVVCSTLDSGSGEMCSGGGFVVGRGEVTGGVALVTVTLAEGAQSIHVEAEARTVSSPAFEATVDTLPPEIVSVVFPDNDAANDVPGVTRFAGGELDTDGAVGVTVTVADLEPGQPLKVVSASSTREWSSSSSVFSLAQSFPDGTYTVAFVIADVAGNEARAELRIAVDRSTGSVTVDAPLATPYTAPSVASGVTVSDSTGGGQVVLARFAGPVGGAALASYTSGVLAPGQTHIPFASVSLPQGLSYLEATYTDDVGNIAVSPRVLYAVDAIGPTISLGVRTAAGVLQSCDTLATACLADTRDLAAGRIGLDRTAADTTCGFGPCSSFGTELFFALSECVNSDASLETCPVDVLMQSRRAGDSAWADVASGTFTSGETLDAAVLTDPRFDPATTRELRLVTQDSNGNAAVSNSVFLTLNFSGTRIDQVERLTAALAPTGDLLDDNRYYGIADSVVDPASGQFQTNFRVYFTAYDVTPTNVRITVDSIAGTSAYEVPVLASGLADLAGVALAVAADPANPTTNTVTVQAMCGPDPCGPRIYTGIVADIEAPTYEFARATLCANGVPLVPTGCDPSAAIAGAGNPAIWNLARDADHDGGNGFNAQPIIVELHGLEDGRTVRLTTDLGSLGNDSVLATGGIATFGQLTASHLPGSDVRRISVSFTDRAGNVAKPVATRIDSNRESIYARTDVIAPRAVMPDVCIGESTGSDPASTEPGTCAAACSATGACNRTAASATLSWSAPGDDDGAGTVSSYFIGVAALGIDYGGTRITDCADIALTGYERIASLPTAPLVGGAVERLAVEDLYPHRDYCVVVAATDDVGNEGPRTVVARRKIPLVTMPNPQTFDGVVRDDAQAAGAFRSEPAAPPDYGAFATRLADLDADGRDDFAVTQLTSGSVQIFLSGAPAGAFAPTLTINAPAIAYSGSFGAAVAGGDFDGDGLNDLVICDPTITTTGFAQAGARGGALFLYYGVAGTGITRATNTTTPQVPSLHPDASLLGAAGQELCANVIAGDARLVVTTGPTSNAARGFIIAGGTRARLPAGPSSFDVTTGPDAMLAVTAPHRLATGDFDADGVDETAIADRDRVYVFDGATLAATVDVLPGSGFGNELVTVHSPGGGAGDWLLVGTTDGRVVVLSPGFMNDPMTYTFLDNTDWAGGTLARFGGSLASLGSFDARGGADVAIGPGVTSSGGPYATVIYSFDNDTGVFEKRAILEGGAGFGSVLAGVNGKLLVVQRVTARLFMFR